MMGIPSSQKKERHPQKNARKNTRCPKSPPSNHACNAAAYIQISNRKTKGPNPCLNLAPSIYSSSHLMRRVMSLRRRCVASIISSLIRILRLLELDTRLLRRASVVILGLTTAVIPAGRRILGRCAGGWLLVLRWMAVGRGAACPAGSHEGL